ncbi:hypothetical protein GPJ56_005327 [Histomonas meleagridis]|uniref:uncharacterized protein n=1 Tax=Histomonas meleagridis TaxID=135588 RepID=UPI00355A16DF|nr:hypothetical protein GPJ56_005327 [Histomonas meleagridis]KAH0796307.1 hypothetical protein GO595_010200 [Histomonas meleagridis]
MTYTENEFNSDLDQIKNNVYQNILALKYVAPQNDLFLLYRYQFIQLLYYFRTNTFDRLNELANSHIENLVEIIRSTDYKNCIFSEIPTPPFDFFILTFMSSTNASTSKTSLYTLLFQHYIKINELLNNAKSSQNIYLNDRTRSSDISVSVDEAKTIVQDRINFVSELFVSYLFSQGQIDLLISFLREHLPPSFVKDEKALSHLGRIAAACGEQAISQSYFDLVKDSSLKSANKGYQQFLEKSFTESRQSFSRAGASAPAKTDAIGQHTCELVVDPTGSTFAPKPKTPEERSQWPLQPTPIKT